MNEMRLVDLVNNEKTDKNTVHSYLNLYQSLLQNKSKHICLSTLYVFILKFI